MIPPNWVRIGTPYRDGDTVVYPLTVDREAAEADGVLVEGTAGSDDPVLGPDAARWTPEDDG